VQPQYHIDLSGSSCSVLAVHRDFASSYLLVATPMSNVRVG